MKFAANTPVPLRVNCSDPLTLHLAPPSHQISNLPSILIYDHIPAKHSHHPQLLFVFCAN